MSDRDLLLGFPADIGRAVFAAHGVGAGFTGYAYTLDRDCFTGYTHTPTNEAGDGQHAGTHLERQHRKHEISRTV